MIHEVSGDILKTEAMALAHGVAPNDNFGQGLALSLRELWPALYKDFRHFCHEQTPKCGEIWAWQGAGGPKIINLFTQEPPHSSGQHPGRAQIQHVNHSLREVHKLIEKEKIKSLALPKIATGVGGLDWNEVYPLIQSQLGKLPIPIYLYSTFKKGEKANEPQSKH